MGENHNPIAPHSNEGMSPERSNVSRMKILHCVVCVECLEYDLSEIPFSTWNERDIWIKAHHDGEGHTDFILFSREGKA